MSHTKTERIASVIHAWLRCGVLAGGIFFSLKYALRPALESGARPRPPASKYHAPPSPMKVTGLFEAEGLVVAVKSRDFTFAPQDLAHYAVGRWYGDAHMWASGTRPGDWADIELPPQPAGTYRLTLFLTKANDYGIVRFEVNGKPIGEEIDLFSHDVEPSGPIALGPIEMREKKNLLRITLTGKNKESGNFFFGIDAIALVPRAAAGKKAKP